MKPSKKQQHAEELKRSDVLAQIVGRDDIEYGEHTELPSGENVALIGADRRGEYRRQIERREPKQGATVRHDDVDSVPPKRIRRAQ